MIHQFETKPSSDLGQLHQIMMWFCQTGLLNKDVGKEGSGGGGERVKEREEDRKKLCTHCYCFKRPNT